nr:unnamed protein product [Spirometra erinaceieuropaei]
MSESENTCLRETKNIATVVSCLVSIIKGGDELPIQQAEVEAAVDPKVQKPKSSPTEEQVAAAEETGEVAARATITSEQAAEEVEQAQEYACPCSPPI